MGGLNATEVRFRRKLDSFLGESLKAVAASERIYNRMCYNPSYCRTPLILFNDYNLIVYPLLKAQAHEKVQVYEATY